MLLPYANLQMHHWNPGASKPLLLPIQVVCNTSDEDVYENVRFNSKTRRKWVRQEPAHDGVAILCGSGPSLADNIGEIRYRASMGQKVFAMNGAAKFLAENGVVPDYQVIIDARAETAQLVGPAKEHLFASQCHPDTWAKAPEALLWHLTTDEGAALFDEGDESEFTVGGAASVGNTATCLAYSMGYRKLELYGYDSSHRDSLGHAFPQPMNEGDPLAHVEFAGEEYLCSLTMKLQAERFQVTSRELKNLGVEIKVHGDGLLPAMFNAPKEVLQEYEKYERMWTQEAYRNMSPGEGLVGLFLEKMQPVGTISGTVIDFGCGTGRAALRLNELGINVVLVDFVENSRDEPARHLPFVKHDITQPLPKVMRFSNGLCTDVMEHIEPDKVSQTIQNIMTVADSVMFQISTIPDKMGALIGQTLHLTVKPASWWKEQFTSLGYAIKWERETTIDVLLIVSKEK